MSGQSVVRKDRGAEINARGDGEGPHPTPLRGATFSHKWEKGGRPFDLDYWIIEIESNGVPSFSHLWEKVALA